MPVIIESYQQIDVALLRVLLLRREYLTDRVGCAVKGRIYEDC
ncbi:MAG: hypothetical protein AAFO04_30045 [Cyanobacteria bacterium J06592_8]